MQVYRDLKPARIIQTWQIWEESGISPEPGWLVAVECLHRHATHEPDPKMTLAALSTSFREIIDTAASLPGFHIMDHHRMLTYARLCGIDVTGRSDHDIALRITGTILSDYGVQLSDVHDLIPPVPVEGQRLLRSPGHYERTCEQDTNSSEITS
jgi:hypothetical protein